MLKKSMLLLIKERLVKSYYGSTSCKRVQLIMRDPETGNSRGFGFISYDLFEASDAPIETMNGQCLCNRQITVSYAYKKDTKGERHGTPAERVLAASNPTAQKSRPHTIFASGPPPSQPNGTASAPILPRPFAVPPPPIQPFHPQPPQTNIYPPIQMSGPPSSWQQGQPPQPDMPGMPPPMQQQFRNMPPPPPPPPQQMNLGFMRPPPTPAGFASPSVWWLPPPPPQQLAGGQYSSMQQMPMPPPPPPQ